MDFFDFLTMVGGLALFLYGMDVMGDGLAKTSGGKQEKNFQNHTPPLNNYSGSRVGKNTVHSFSKNRVGCRFC